ncbi:MAG: diacylglycerol kinase family protein [Candidatus Acidiferrales bacterium]
MTPDTLIIVNPIAGGGRAGRLQAAIARYFADHHRPVEFVASKNTEDFRRIASDAVASGYRYLVALGGDGSFHHLVEATFGSPAILGFIPAGNGNDIAEGLNIPRDPIEAAHAFLNGRPRAVDAVRVHFTSESAPPRVSIFIGAGGLGLDAEAAQLANTRFRAWPGVTRYIAGALWARRNFRSLELEAAMDGEFWRGRVLFAAVANAPCYGSGVRIAPSAKMDDGWLEVTLVQEMPLARLLEAIPIVLRSGDIRWPEVCRYRCRRVTFKTNRPALVHGDGEILGNSPAEFEVVPGAVQVMLSRNI